MGRLCVFASHRRVLRGPGGENLGVGEAKWRCHVAERMKKGSRKEREGRKEHLDNTTGKRLFNGQFISDEGDELLPVIL